MTVYPVVNQLDKNQQKKYEGFIKLDRFGNPSDKNQQLKNNYGSKILIGKFFKGEGFTIDSFN